MSYPEDLDEIPTNVLRKEILERKTRLADRRCPYCNQPLSTHTCKYKDGMSLIYNSVEEQLLLKQAGKVERTTYCEICGAAQVICASGITCLNGHGGAPRLMYHEMVEKFFKKIDD